MSVINIKNNLLRRTTIVVIFPVILIVYAAFGAMISVCDYLVEDIKAAWRGSK